MQKPRTIAEWRQWSKDEGQRITDDFMQDPEDEEASHQFDTFLDWKERVEKILIKEYARYMAGYRKEDVVIVGKAKGELDQMWQALYRPEPSTK